ncbi:MAG: thioesterase [Bacteroidales bacterium]|jgi:medium-chain acyl-[acyl-carrier-protein] hydrolase|nr:thioesterase [Bacteroidales bacterium]
MNRLIPPFPTDIPQLSTNNFVSWHDVDFSGFLSLYSLFNFAQATAWKHAEELGFGFEELGDNKLAWVLFGMRIKIIGNLPQWQQNLIIQTQPKGISGMFANRDYRMLDTDNQLIAIGSSNWLVIDIETRRPLRLDKVFDSLRFVENPENLVSRIKTKGDFPLSQNNYTVKTSDIDYYGHVNNAKYISWITDLYSPEQLKEHPLDEILVNFLQETRFGDQIEIFTDKAENNGKVRYKMQRKSDEKVILLAEAEWK